MDRYGNSMKYCSKNPSSVLRSCDTVSWDIVWPSTTGICIVLHLDRFGHTTPDKTDANRQNSAADTFDQDLHTGGNLRQHKFNKIKMANPFSMPSMLLLEHLWPRWCGGVLKLPLGKIPRLCRIQGINRYFGLKLTVTRLIHCKSQGITWWVNMSGLKHDTLLLCTFHLFNHHGAFEIPTSRIWKPKPTFMFAPPC